MAVSAVDIVNQRLYCCRLQLDSYRALVDKDSLPLAITECLQGEALIHHLRECYRSYLAELAVNYQGPDQYYRSAVLLTETMHKLGINAAEINELCILERQSEGWLMPLLGYIPSVNNVVKTSHSAGLIELRELNTAVMVTELDFLDKAYQGLMALIDNQRSCSQEW